MTAEIHDPAGAKRSLQFVAPGRTTLCFAGPPGGLTGSIPLVNHADVKLKLRSIRLRSSSLKGEAAAPLVGMPIFAALYPGEQASVPGTIVLDSSTLPGLHRFELTIGDTTVAAEAHVEEVVDLRISPSRLTLLAGGSGTSERTLVVENAGNLDLPLGARCETPIFNPNDLASALVAGINDSDKSSVEAMVKGILLRWGDLQAGTLVTRRDPVTLHPGQRLSMRVRFDLPAQLKPLSHYRADLQLYNAALTVDIYTSANYGRKPRTRAKRKR